MLPANPDILMLTLQSPLGPSGLTPVVDSLASNAGGRIEVGYLSPRSTPMTPERPYPITCFTADDIALTVGNALPDLMAAFGARGKGRAKVLRALEPHLKRFRAIVIADPLPLSWAVPKLKRLFKGPVCLLAQSDDLGELLVAPGASRRRRRLLAADHLFAASDFLHDMLVRKMGFRGRWSSRIRLGADVGRIDKIDASTVRAAHGLPSTGLLVVAAAPLVAHAGTDQVIRAWTSVGRCMPAATLVVVGDGPERVHLQNLAEGDSTIQFLPDLRGNAMVAVIKASDVFVRPNRREPGGADIGAGILFLRAAAAGVPAIGGRTGATPEVVRNGETGLVVDGRTLDEVAGAIIRLLAAPEARQQMGHQARQWAEAHKAEAAAEAFVAEIDAVIGAGRAA